MLTHWSYVFLALTHRYDDVIKLKHFLHYWPFVWRINWSPVNSPQKPVMWSFDIFFDVHLNKQLSKQSWHKWFETPLCSLWRHCNDFVILQYPYRTLLSATWLFPAWVPTVPIYNPVLPAPVGDKSSAETMWTTQWIVIFLSGYWNTTEWCLINVLWQCWLKTPPMSEQNALMVWMSD